MKNLVIVFGMFLFSFFSISCKKREIKEIFLFSKYDRKGNILEHNFARFEITLVNDSIDDVSLLSKDSVFLQFKELSNNKGVFRKFSDKYRPYYSFDSTQNGGTNNIFSPLINKETWLINKRIFQENNLNYLVYHFEEMSYCTPSISTFWVKNLGIIGVITFDGETEFAYLCDEIKGNKDNDLLMKRLSKKLLSDTVFFTKAKYLPCKL